MRTTPSCARCPTATRTKAARWITARTSRLSQRTSPTSERWSRPASSTSCWRTEAPAARTKNHSRTVGTARPLNTGAEENLLHPSAGFLQHRVLTACDHEMRRDVGRSLSTLTLLPCKQPGSCQHQIRLETWRIDELCSYVLDRKHTMCSVMFPHFSPGFTDQKLSAPSNQLTPYLWLCERRCSNRKRWNQADAVSAVNLLALTQSSSLKQVMHFKAISSFYRRAAQISCSAFTCC